MPPGHRSRSPPREAPVPPAHSCNRFPKNLLTGSFRGGICSGEAPGNLNPADLWHGTRLAHGAGGPARASSPLGTHRTWLGPFGSPAWLWGGSTWIHHNPDSFGPRLRFQGGIFVSFWPPRDLLGQQPSAGAGPGHPRTGSEQDGATSPRQSQEGCHGQGDVCRYLGQSLGEILGPGALGCAVLGAH